MMPCLVTYRNFSILRPKLGLRGRNGAWDWSRKTSCIKNRVGPVLFISWWASGNIVPSIRDWKWECIREMK